MAANERLLYATRGEVWLEADERTVRKEYAYGDLELSRYQAQQEFDHLRRFEVALQSVAGVRCPRPLSLIEGDEGTPPAVRMEMCAGEELFFFLLRPDLSAEVIRSIADRMAVGLVAYIDTFDEPYIDHSLHNALFDPESNMLTLLDFGPWRREPSPIIPIEPLESSLGSLFGMALRPLLGPSRRPSWRRRLQLIRTVSTVVTRVEQQSGRHAVGPAGIRARAWRIYRRHANQGRILRRLWYRGVGAVLVWLVLRYYRSLAF